MDYNNIWFKSLKTQFENDFKKYKDVKYKYKYKDFKKDKLVLDKSKKHIKIEIINNKIINKKIEIINNKIINKKIEDINLKNHYIIRKNKVIDLFTLAINYAEKNNLPKITGEFFVNIKDTYDWDINIYPTFVYARPKNKKNFLLPDFLFLKFEKKIETFDKNCNKKKKNLIYFKGNKTSINYTKIREKLSLLKKPFNISVDEKQRLPYYNLCYYKYVLDLSGTKPWSVRLTELYMSQSLPIRIIFYNSRWNEEQWVQFYELCFPPWDSYIPLYYDINYHKEVSDDIIKDIKLKCLKILKFFNKDKKSYNKITNNNYLKMKALRMEHIEYYMYHSCINYLKLVNKFSNKDNYN